MFSNFLRNITVLSGGGAILGIVIMRGSVGVRYTSSLNTRKPGLKVADVSR